MRNLAFWTPNRDLVGLQEEMDRLFENAFGYRTAGNGETRLWVPASDVREGDEGFTLRLDLPGVDRKDVKVSVSGDTVHVRGERVRATEEKSKDGGWQRLERFHGKFERLFQLGVPLQADRVSAVYKDGVLEIQVPKADSVRPREIEIQVSGN